MPQSIAMAVAPVESMMELSRKRRTPRSQISLRLLQIHFVGIMCRKYMSVVSALLRKPVMSIT